MEFNWSSVPAMTTVSKPKIAPKGSTDIDNKGLLLVFHKMYPELYPYYGMLEWWVRIPDFVVVQHPSYVIAVSREGKRVVWAVVGGCQSYVST